MSNRRHWHMFEERDVRVDVFALGLFVLVVFVSLSLVSYHPSDPVVELVYPLNELYQPDVLTYPVSETAQNWCGPWGALVASVMFEALGLGAFYTAISLGVLTALLLMRREVDSPVLRTLGWVLSLMGLTTLVTLVAPWMTPGPVTGAGGYLGTLCAGLLRIYFADLGGLILAISFLVGGLLLCTDYVLVHLGLMLGTLTVAGVMGLNRRSATRRSANDEADDEEWDEEEYEDDEEEEDEDATTPVRVGGRRITAAELAADDEDELHEDAEYEDEEDEYESEAVVLDDDEEEYEDDEEDQPDELPVKTPVTKAAAAAAAVGATLLRSSRGRRRLSPFRVHRPPESDDREDVMNQLDVAALRDDAEDYELPNLDLLVESEDFCYDEQAKEVRRKAKILEKTFASFGHQVKVVEIETGPVIAQYEIELESGLRLSKITGLADDVAIALRVPSVRIVAPIPGKNTVGIEVPNEDRQLVRLREVMESQDKSKKMEIPLFLGKDVSGNPLTIDLAKLPHLLIAGRTGTGKSVCLNAMIASILMTRRPDEVRFLMIDPKMVELSGYKSLPHLMHPVVTDMRKAEAILAWAVEKMEERYALLARAGVRHMNVYNQLSDDELMDRIQPETDDERKAIPSHMPYIVIVADEMADLMMTAGKEVEQHIIRLAQKSRAVGIHLILATQKPTVDVITGLIKSNLPARIAFQVASRTDSRVVLDEMGADKLLGNGDMLFLSPGTSMVTRGQGTYLGDDEINALVDAVSTGEQHFVKELVQLKVESRDASTGGQLKNRDELYEAAVETVITEQRGSVSLLQRAHGIGYGRAARLIDFMAEDGIVGPYAGAQAREVLMSMVEWEALKNGAVTDSAADEIADRVLADAEYVEIKATQPAADVQDDEQDAEEEVGNGLEEDSLEEEMGVADEAEAEPADEEAADEEEDEEEYEYVYEDEDGNEVPAGELADDECEYEDEEYDYEDGGHEYDDEEYEAESA